MGAAHTAIPPLFDVYDADLVPLVFQGYADDLVARTVAWEVANALDLPYAEASFDAVVCGFGAMFFSPHHAAYAEARRVLRPGGTYLFTVWDCLDRNDLCRAVAEAVAEIFPDDPPGFLTRTPYGYFDADVIVADLAAGGFSATPRVERLEHPARAATALDAARAICAGTPLRDEILVRGDDALEHAIEETAQRLAARFGSTGLEGATSAVCVTVTR